MPRSVRTPLLGKTTPRIFSAPLVQGPPGPCGCGCALTPRTSKGFSAIDFAEQVLGWKLIPWQRWLLIHALELRADGKFRFRTVLILVARQNGKTSLVEVKNLWKMFVEGVSLIISVAQELDVAEESWDNAVAIIEGIPELNAEKREVKEGNGKKQLMLSNGARWKPKAAGRRPGRGLSGDDVNLDELREHQNWLAWAAVTKTRNARPNPQTWAFSNAGDDKSIVLNTLRDAAVAAIESPADDIFAQLAEMPELAALAAEAAESFGLFEWSAPDDVRCTCVEKGVGRPHDAQCRLWDRQAWAQANPSLGYTITEATIASDLMTDPEEIFRTEVLCQRVPDLAPPKIPLTAWVKCADPHSVIASQVVLSWEIAWDRSRGVIGVAGYTAAGLPQVEVVEYREGTDWIAGRLGEICKRQPVAAVVYNPAGPGASLLTEVTERLPVRFEPQTMTARDQANACGRIYDAVMPAPGADRGVLRHLGDARLLEALRKSSTRTLVDAWAWDMRNSAGEISPLAVVTNALHGLFVYGKIPAPAPEPIVDMIPGARTEVDLMAIGF